MADSLNPLQYGTVVGRFLVELGDSDDPNLTPDVHPVRGYLTFTPATSYANVKTALPDPATIFPQTIYGVLDADGYVCSVQVDSKGNPRRTAGGDLIPSFRGIRMQASSDPNIIPSNWTWNVRFNLYFNNTNINYDSFNFTLDPLQVADLSYIKPTNQVPGTITITGPIGPKGETGAKGDTGPANELSIGEVTTRPTGSAPTASITGDVPNQVINLGLPQGPVGPSGGPIPAGGTANQLLKKTDSGGYEWFTPSHDKPIAIASGIDLDTLIAPGDYHQSSNAGASAGTNYPVPFAGMLYVRAAGSFIYQYYNVYATAGGSAGKQFSRAKYGTTWTDWKESGNTEVATPTKDGLMSSTDKSILDKATTDTTGSTLVKRWSTGQITVPTTPTSSTHSASKSYVDSQNTQTKSYVDSQNTQTKSYVDAQIADTKDYAHDVALSVSELAWAQITSDFAVPSSTGGEYIEVPGTTLTFTMPNRPVYLTAEIMSQYVTTSDRSRVQIYETTGNTVHAQVPMQQAASGTDFPVNGITARITGKEGQTRTFILKIQRAKANFSLKAGSTFPITFRAEQK